MEKVGGRVSATRKLVRTASRAACVSLVQKFMNTVFALFPIITVKAERELSLQFVLSEAKTNVEMY